MATYRWVLPWLAVSGAILLGCNQRRQESTPQTSAAETTGAMSVPDSAPGAQNTSSTMDVKDTTWELVGITTPAEQIKVDKPDHYTVRFGSDGHLTMRADCNRGMGNFTMSADGKLTMKPIALTRAMCLKESISDRFAKDVGRATSYAVKDGELLLQLPGDSGTLRFRRQT